VSLVEEATPDEVLADEHKGDAEESAWVQFRMAVEQPKDTGLPEEREASPENAEGHEENVSAGEPKSPVGLPRPHHLLVLEQIGLKVLGQIQSEVHIFIIRRG